VKQKDRVGRRDIDAFEAMMTRAERTKGSFVSSALPSVDTQNRQLIDTSKPAIT